MRIRGSEGPAVVLLHGLGTSGDFWGRGYDALAARHRVVVPDLPGFGRRPWPASRCRIDDHADALARSLRAAGFGGEPVLVVGHSLGALVALALARRQPQLVRGMVVFGAPLAADGRALRRAVRRTVAATARRRAVVGWAGLAADIPAQLAAATVPVRLVIGTKDAVADLAAARSLAEQNPDVGVVEWQHADQYVASAYPAACRVQIEKLVAGLERPLSIVG